ncbi:MAG: hypothetical protein IKK27_02185 [Alistipes sp.]|nr:hypothetical protein [Alistipes sp.]
MKKVHIRNYILLIFASIFLVGCSLEKSEGESAVQQPVELVIRASQGGATRAMENVDDVIEVGAELAPAADNSTRTELGPATDTEQPIFWSCYYDEKERKEVADQIMVWAEPAVSPQDWAFAQTVFSLAHFNHDYHSADFTATVANTMDRDYDYTYYAIYPSPKSRNKQGVESAVSGITLNGTEVTYTLSANQSGEYNPAYDIMWGEVSGAALVERDGSGSIEVWRQPELRMKHLLHMMRIRVPEGRNLLGRDVKRLEITFPRAVVGGTVTVDVKTGAVTWSGQSNKVTIDLADESLLDEGGRYVWVQIKPEVLNGEISFQAYDDYGVPTQALSTTIDKTLSAGHITPVNLTIPTSKYDNVTYIEIEETANNLGEAWNTMTLSGYTFVKPFTLETTDKNVVTPNDAKKYKVAIVAAASSLQNGAIAASYDSPNAIVSNSIKLPPTISNNLAEVDSQVPYLLFEDFSRIVNEEELYGNNTYDSSDRNQPGQSLSQLPGWSAARYWAKQGAFRLNVRWQMVKIFYSFTSTHYGRLDSVPLSALKSSANVKLKVQFDAGANVHSSSDSGAKQGSYAYISLATHTNSSNPINGVGIGTAQDGSLSDFGTTYYTSNAMASLYGADDFQNTYPTHTVEIGSATKTTRLCFYPSTTFSTGGFSNAEFNVYLDNIRVSIAN